MLSLFPCRTFTFSLSQVFILCLSPWHLNMGVSMVPPKAPLRQKLIHRVAQLFIMVATEAVSAFEDDAFFMHHNSHLALGFPGSYTKWYMQGSIIYFSNNHLALQLLIMLIGCFIYGSECLLPGFDIIFSSLCCFLWTPHVDAVGSLLSGLTRSKLLPASIYMCSTVQ